MKKKLTKTQQLAEDKKKKRQDNMKKDIQKVGIGFFTDGAKQYGDVPFTFTGYVNCHLNSLADDYICKYYGSMGNPLLKINARLETANIKGYKPLSKRTICRIFDEYQVVLINRGLLLHLIP
jgi:hypothetical protein